MGAVPSSSTENKRCGVCTGFLLSGQPFLTSVCAHTFHVGCYQHHSNKNQTCPVCFARWTSTNEIFPEDEASKEKVSMKAQESIAKARESKCGAHDYGGYGGYGYAGAPSYCDPYTYPYGAPRLSTPAAAPGPSSFGKSCCVAGIRVFFFFFFCWGLRAFFV